MPEDAERELRLLLATPQGKAQNPSTGSGTERSSKTPISPTPLELNSSTLPSTGVSTLDRIDLAQRRGIKEGCEFETERAQERVPERGLMTFPPVTPSVSRKEARFCEWDCAFVPPA